jgi:hypothetical protein
LRPFVFRLTISPWEEKWGGPLADLNHGVIDSRGIETDGLERCDEHASRV